MGSMEVKDNCSEIVHYTFDDYPIFVRKSLLSSYDNFEAPPHWHDDIEFIAVLQGEMNYNVNGEIINLKEKEGIFVNSRQLHYGFSQNKMECNFVCVLIHPMMLCVSQNFEREFVSSLLVNQSRAYIKLFDNEGWEREIFDSIVGMYDAKDEVSAVPIISSLFLKIWAIIFNHTKVPVNKQSQNNDFTILKNMIGFIQKSYKEKITLNDIAKSGAVGQSKCCKLFEKHIGTTPNTYLINYRLHQSTWYLKNTDMTITEIADSVGFSGSSYYAEAFKKRYGKTPREFRK